MKKTLLLSLACLLIGSAAHAQLTNFDRSQIVRTQYDRSQEEFYYGVTVGVNVANMAKNQDGNALARLNAGAFGGYRFSRLFALQAELLYSGSGTSLYIPQIEDQKIDDVIHLNMNYINVPILAKFYVAGGLNLYTGIQFAFLVSQKFNFHNEKIRTNLNAHKVDYALPIGIGYDFNHFLVSLRYQQGLIDIFKDQAADKENNTLLSFNIGYRF